MGMRCVDGLRGIDVLVTEPCFDSRIKGLFMDGATTRPDIEKPRLGSWVIECRPESGGPRKKREDIIPERVSTDPRSTTKPGHSPRRNSSRSSPNTRVSESGPRPKSPPRSLTPVPTCVHFTFRPVEVS